MQRYCTVCQDALLSPRYRLTGWHDMAVLPVRTPPSIGTHTAYFLLRMQCVHDNSRFDCNNGKHTVCNSLYGTHPYIKLSLRLQRVLDQNTAPRQWIANFVHKKLTGGLTSSSLGTAARHISQSRIVRPSAPQGAQANYFSHASATHCST